MARGADTPVEESQWRREEPDSRNDRSFEPPWPATLAGGVLQRQGVAGKRPPPGGEGTFRFQPGERSDEASAFDPAADPTAEAEGGTGAEQGQGAGDSICLREVVADVVITIGSRNGIPHSNFGHIGAEAK